MKPIGSREYFDEVEARKYKVEPHIPIFARFDQWRDKKVLEIGCGIGTDTINFARAGAEVVAIDLSTSSIELAKKRAQVFGLEDKISFYNTNSEQLSQTVPIEPFDLIYSFGVIHHSPHPELILKELKKYVKPGTTLKVMVYYKFSWKVLWIICTYGFGRFWKYKELAARYSEAQTGCPVTYIYSKNEGKKLLQAMGAKMVSVEVDHIFPYSIPEYKEYRYVKKWYFRILPTGCYRWLERVFGWHLLLTARF